MKRGMLTTAIVFVLALVHAALAQTAGDEQLVVPGERMGRWSLNLRLPELRGMAGTEPMPFFPSDTRPGLGEVGWVSGPARGLRAGYRDARIEYLAVDFSYGVGESLRTAKDVGNGSTQAAVVAAYGQPSVQMLRPPGMGGCGGVRMIFDNIGLAVQISDGKAICMEVFRPGKAKEIWRF